MPSLKASATALAAASLLLAGCSSTPQSVDGSTLKMAHTPAAPSGATSGPAAPTRITGGPLTAADLHAWTKAAAPAGMGADWLSLCGSGTGVAALQKHAEQTALRAPGGALVLTRVATYPHGQAAQVLSAVAGALANCPLSTDGPLQVTATQMTGPSGSNSVGALVTARTAAGLAASTTGYWVTQVGDATVEVLARANFATLGPQDPMSAFSAAVDAAALAKATGAPVPQVSVPPYADAAGNPVGTAAGPAGSPAGTTGGTGSDSAGATGSGAAPGAAVGPSVTDPGAGDPGANVPAPPPGVGGESGPGAVTGSGTP